MSINILSCKPSHIKLRVAQEDALQKVAENWDKYRVFAIQLPVGSGKSIVGITIANWAEKAKMLKTAACTPTKILQDQYVNDFNWLPVLKGSEEYTCNNFGGNCGKTKKIIGKYCSGCLYTGAKEKAAAANIAIFNYHSYFFNEMHKTKDVLVLDEGHSAISFIYDLFGVKIWQNEANYPNDIKCLPDDIRPLIESLIEDVSEDYALALTKGNERLVEDLEHKKTNYENVLKMLKIADKVLIVQQSGRYPANGQIEKDRGKSKEYIYIKPIDISGLAENILWPKDRIKKVIFMSATITDVDMKALGFGEDEVCFIEGRSPIPAQNRPIVFVPGINMSYRTRQESMGRLIDTIEQIMAKNPDKKGIIHCTYETANILKNSFKNNRLLFHDNKNKQAQYNLFKKTKEPLVLVASGMAEGIDLPDDAARWQIITQVMFPNLSDPLNCWICNNNKDLYYQMAVKTIEQQYGRVVRHENDHGVTIICDAQFLNLFRVTHTDRVAAGKKSLWSETFLEGLVNIDINTGLQKTL